MQIVEQLQALTKALEAGSYNAAPSTLTQGSSIQIEDMSPVMENVTFEDKAIKLQRMLSKKEAKGTLIQFNRQLDYGIFGGSAQYEGALGEEDTSSFVRDVVPMAYYSTVRRVSVASNLIQAFDGQKAEDRSADDAAKKLSADIEFDSFRGMDDFSNAGVFDGAPQAVAALPGMVGAFAQIRASDAQANTQDLMFSEFGSSESVVLPVNGTLTQSTIEDMSVRSAMNHGSADKFLADPIVLSAYNKIAFLKERIMLAGSAQEASGATLRKQWTSGSVVDLEASRFLSGKTKPARNRGANPLATPSIASTATSGSSGIIPTGTYTYYVTAANERGEGNPSAYASQAVTYGAQINVTITNVSGAKYYNVYRSNAGGSAAQAKLIGKVKASSTSTTVFNDLGNRLPGSVTGILLQSDTMDFRELAPFSTLKLAVHDLSLPQASFSFLCLAAKQPRKNVLADNLQGQL
jgi:hypothetical protein